MDVQLQDTKHPTREKRSLNASLKLKPDQAMPIALLFKRRHPRRPNFNAIKTNWRGKRRNYLYFNKVMLSKLMRLLLNAFINFSPTI